jgi:two-component system, cell cycle sensor histidine kinase and response regulator CckA
MLDGHDIRGIKHLLIVDDDASVLTAFTHALTGFRVSAALDPHEALHVANTMPTLDLVITDYLMASMTGEELLAHIRQRHPGVKALFVTGHGNILDEEAPDWWTGEAHLTKPFDATTLKTAVADLIGPPEH